MPSGIQTSGRCLVAVAIRLIIAGAAGSLRSADTLIGASRGRLVISFVVFIGPCGCAGCRRVLIRVLRTRWFFAPRRPHSGFPAQSGRPS